MYPFVLILRHQKYNHLDAEFGQYKVTSDINDIKLLYTEDWNVLVTVGEAWTEYEIQSLMINKLYKKWIHITPGDIKELENRVMACYVANLPKRIEFRPEISAFTPSYKSAGKILRPYRSLLAQTIKNWEWVIIDDTDGDENWKYLTENLKDPRIRIYKRNGNSGSIGNVKNEASSLCRGKYLLELDHDDDLIEDCLETLCKGFESDKEVGFVYMDFAELYENWEPFHYCDGWGPGRHGSYYRQYVKEIGGSHAKWVYVAKSCEINSITITDITGVPNHPRAWRREFINKYGYSESMAIADDYELLVITALNTKILRIPKLGYLQYKNDGASNFSLIRNGDITKIQRAVSNYYRGTLDNFFKEKASHGPEIWKRLEWKETRINEVKNFDYDSTVLITSIDALISENFKTMYNKQRTDFILVLDNDNGIELLLETLGYLKIKFFVINGTLDEIKNYFFRCYLTTKDFVIL